MKNTACLALAFVFSLLGALSAAAQNSHCKNQEQPLPGVLASVNDTRSDSIDILKTTINLTITDFTNQVISGNAKVAFKAKVNGISILRLDLLDLTVDSVQHNGQNLSFLRQNEIIRISLPTTLNANQSDSVTVYYQGHPATDPSGYGGFLYSGQTYAYSIGVGFAAIPHNFGRCWFPCFDNFVERNLFDFNITVSNNKSAVCNGMPIDTVDNGDGTRTFSWRLAEEIPSYLACVSVAQYVTLFDDFPTIGGGDIPVRLYCLAADTTKLKNSFTHLDEAFSIFEDRFGPYLWEKVGYVLVPFVAGAMEHATCISYPTFLVNGQTTYETTMAHELSHNWFGNLVTCDKAEEMYLNEGFARYCEAVFLEGLYGYDSYIDDIRANHRKVLNFVVANDGAHYAIANVPQTVTYGSTSYEKGADVLHTLRSYMGDSLFFNGLKYFLNNHLYDDVNSAVLQQDLESYSGLNLDDFFNYWVLNPGYPQFGVDSMQISPNGSQYNVTVFVRQKLNNAPQLYQNVPFTLTFMGAGFEQSNHNITVGNLQSQATFTVPFYPVFAALNMDDRISHAVTAEGKMFTATGNQTLPNAYIGINPQTLTDSAYVYVEHNWVAPDNFIDDGDVVTLSTKRYWRVTGIAKPDFVAKATFTYNGRTNATNSGWLDEDLVTAGEDSLILMYRPDCSYPWKRYSYANQNTQGNSNDKIGRFDVDTLKFGEYCLAKGLAAVQMPETPYKASKMLLYPNPAGDYLNVTSDLVFDSGAEITIISSMGRLVKTFTVPDATDKLTLSLYGLAPGVYYLRSGNSYARFVVM